MCCLLFCKDTGELDCIYLELRLARAKIVRVGEGSLRGTSTKKVYSIWQGGRIFRNLFMVSSTAYVNHFKRWSSGYGLPPIDGRRRIESRPGHFFPAKNRDFVHGLNAPNIGWRATLTFVRGVNSSATPRYSAGVLAKKVRAYGNLLIPIVPR